MEKKKHQQKNKSESDLEAWRRIYYNTAGDNKVNTCKLAFSRPARRRCQKQTHSSSQVLGVNITFERPAVVTLSDEIMSGGRGRRGSIQFSLLKVFVMQIGGGANIVVFDLKCATHVTRAGGFNLPLLALMRTIQHEWLNLKKANAVYGITWLARIKWLFR